MLQIELSGECKFKTLGSMDIRGKPYNRGIETGQNCQNFSLKLLLVLSSSLCPLNFARNKNLWKTISKGTTDPRQWVFKLASKSRSNTRLVLLGKKRDIDVIFSTNPCNNFDKSRIQFIIIQNLGQTSAWFCLAKGEKYM